MRHKHTLTPVHDIENGRVGVLYRVEAPGFGMEDWITVGEARAFSQMWADVAEQASQPPAAPAG